MASVLCTHVSISRSLNSFPLYKILPSIKHDAENFTSRDHFLLVEPLKFSFKTRLSFKLQRPIGGTNLNVVIVYPHRGHSGRYPRDHRGILLSGLAFFTENAEVRRKRKSTGLEQRN